MSNSDLVLERSIPRLVATFDDVQPLALQQEWQKAIAALCLVLACAARENDTFTASNILVGV
ncbi:MAG: hypothetical protein HC941_32765 [Microcoleus sp. SU_5_3]|nr:hypothetical protein [Microcoleus sp. SU_5_3]